MKIEWTNNDSLTTSQTTNAILVIDMPKDCRKCQEWETCPCGKSGHIKGTSIGYSIGECKDYKEKQNDL